MKTLTATMSIRPLTKTDEPFLWEMLYQAIYVPEGSKRPPRSIIYEPELAKYVQGWGEPGDTGLVATNEAGQPIGAAWLRLLTGDNKGYGYIDDKTPELSIAVLPAYRGKGIGTSLLRRLLIEAQSHFASISLSVSPDNPALRLYRRLGFEVVGENGGSLTMKITLEDTLQNVEK